MKAKKTKEFQKADIPAANLYLAVKATSMKDLKPIQLNDPKIIKGWAFFDWANSAFALVIAVAIFPSYFLAITDDEFTLLGIDMTDSALYAFAVSAAYLLLALVSPWLSGIADYGGKKKWFLRLFTIIGSVSCMSLWFFTSMDTLALGTISFILANIGFAGGLVFYNAYLPLISTEDKYDSVSAKGFIYGYIGSVLLLIVNLALITYAEDLGLDKNNVAVRLAFIMVGLWWLGFAQIPFRRLPDDRPNPPGGNLLKKGVEELIKVWHSLKGLPQTKRFLLSFFFYNAGVQTILFLASTFAKKELSFDDTKLIVLILILQLVAILGAHLFARLTTLATNRHKLLRSIGIWGGAAAVAVLLSYFFPEATPKWLTAVILVIFGMHLVVIGCAFVFNNLFGAPGNKFSIIISLVIWILICILAYLTQSINQFYALAAGVGMVMGGIQSMSRSTYSKLIPEDTEDTTSFFSFYDVLEKVSIMLGTFLFGMIQLLGGMRDAILFLSVFFIIGITVLSKVKMKRDKAIG